MGREKEAHSEERRELAGLAPTPADNNKETTNEKI
jgi:hypothetical protein